MISNKHFLFALIGLVVLALQVGCLPMLDPGPRTRGTWIGVARPGSFLDASRNAHPGWLFEITSGPGLQNDKSAAGGRVALTDADGQVLHHHRLLEPGARLKVNGILRNLTLRASPSGPQVARELGTSGGVPMEFVIMVDSIKPQ